jgi:hypothetical protein
LDDVAREIQELEEKKEAWRIPVVDKINNLWEVLHDIEHEI